MKFKIYYGRWTTPMNREHARSAVDAGSTVLAAAWLCFTSASFAQPSAAKNGVATNVCRIDLPTALKLAGAQNLDVQIARQSLAEAKANHESAVWQFFPWLSPGVGYRRHDDLIQETPGDIIEVHKDSYAVGPTLAAQLDLGDAIYKNLASRQLVKAADYGLESQLQDSILASAQGYFDLARASGLAGVIRESLRISEDYQHQLHEAVGAGIAFKGDELRVQVQTERYQLALRQTLEQQRVAAARLAQVLHLDATVELIPQDSDLAPLTLIETGAALDSLVHRALRSRPEARQSEALASAAKDAKNGATYGPLVPSVGAQVFVGGLGGGREGIPNTFGSSEDYFVGLGWRIGPGGLFDSGRIHATAARLEASKLASAKVTDDITRQVVESHTRVQSLADQLLTTKTNLTTASETLRLTRERKQFGVGAVLEDIQAQQELTRARSDYLNVVADYNKAQYQLAKAVGGLSKAE